MSVMTWVKNSAISVKRILLRVNQSKNVLRSFLPFPVWWSHFRLLTPTVKICGFERLNSAKVQGSQPICLSMSRFSSSIKRFSRKSFCCFGFLNLLFTILQQNKINYLEKYHFGHNLKILIFNFLSLLIVWT